MADTWYDPMHPAAPGPSIWMLFGPFVVVALVLPALALASVFWITRPPSQIEFDAQVWRESPGQEVRWRMHRDLLRSGQLEGKTVYEVLDLLGPPAPYRETDGHKLEYNMGIEQEALFAVDGVWLLLYFDAEGVFQRHEVATD
jgi:hypothetical protein